MSHGAKHHCPYCKHAFRKTPKHRSKCPNCGQQLWLRIAPGEKEKKLYTTAQSFRLEIAEMKAGGYERYCSESIKNIMKQSTPHHCPYCKKGIKTLKKKQRCPHCDQVMLLKLAFGEKIPRLVTEWQAKRIDIIWHNWDVNKNMYPELTKDGTLRIKLEYPEPRRPLITLSGDEILNEIK